MCALIYWHNIWWIARLFKKKELNWAQKERGVQKNEKGATKKRKRNERGDIFLIHVIGGLS